MRKQKKGAGPGGPVRPDFRIDPEIKKLIPAHSPEERAMLRASLEKVGCLQPVLVRKGRGTPLDGHLRLELCGELGIVPEVVEVELDDGAVRDFVIDLQMARRNLTRQQSSYLRGACYNDEKAGHGGSRRKGPNPEGTTAKRLAERFKTSRRPPSAATASSPRPWTASPPCAASRPGRSSCPASAATPAGRSCNCPACPTRS
jgi:hypothetical protein